MNCVSLLEANNRPLHGASPSSLTYLGIAGVGRIVNSNSFSNAFALILVDKLRKLC